MARIMGKWQKHKETSHTREPLGQPFPNRRVHISYVDLFVWENESIKMVK